MKFKKEKVIGAVIAGGKSLRMDGQDKRTIKLGGVTLLENAMSRLAPQCEEVVISYADLPLSQQKNTDKEVFIADVIADKGPLGGIYSVMAWAKQNRPAVDRIVTCPADSPFLPKDLIEQFINKPTKNNNDPICLASWQGSIEPLFGIWQISIVDKLEHYIKTSARLSVLSFAKFASFETLDISSQHSAPFFNINTPDDMALAQEIFEREKNG